MNILAVLLGGGTGAVSRYLLSRFITEHSTAPVPLGTLAVNCIGSFFIGFFFQAFKDFNTNLSLRLFITTGFLGGFTTFSTYALETIYLAKERELGQSLLNITLENGLGLLAVLGGIVSYSMLKSLVTATLHM